MTGHVLTGCQGQRSACLLTTNACPLAVLPLSTCPPVQTDTTCSRPACCGYNYNQWLLALPGMDTGEPLYPCQHTAGEPGFSPERQASGAQRRDFHEWGQEQCARQLLDQSDGSLACQQQRAPSVTLASSGRPCTTNRVAACAPCLGHARYTPSSSSSSSHHTTRTPVDAGCPAGAKHGAANGGCRRDAAAAGGGHAASRGAQARHSSCTELAHSARRRHGLRASTWALAAVLVMAALVGRPVLGEAGGCRALLPCLAFICWLPNQLALRGGARLTTRARKGSAEVCTAYGRRLAMAHGSAVVQQ